MTFCERLKALRGDMTQTAFAKKLGFPQNTYHRYERGERVPDIKALAKISKSLKMSADDILGIKDVKLDHVCKHQSGRHASAADERDATIARQAEAIVALTRQLQKLTEQIKKS